nr:LamB/YcsF family protein [Salinivirgaceae bacterium]
AAREVGLKSACEVFADRAYNDDGSLVSRFKYGAVFHDSETCLQQVKKIIIENSIQTINGNSIEACVDSICINGDNSEALDFVKTFHKFLAEKEVKLKSLKA